MLVVDHLQIKDYTSFCAKHWKSFRNKVWRDLEVPGLDTWMLLHTAFVYQLLMTF